MSRAGDDNDGAHVSLCVVLMNTGHTMSSLRCCRCLHCDTSVLFHVGKEAVARNEK